MDVFMSWADEIENKPTRYCKIYEPCGANYGFEQTLATHTYTQYTKHIMRFELIDRMDLFESER